MGRESHNSTSGESLLKVKKKTWERRLLKAKRKHRPRLKEWNRDEFACRRKNLFYQLGDFESQVPVENSVIDIVPCMNLSPDSFVREYESRNIPCIISHIPTMERWKAPENWTIERLYERFKERKFKVGEDDDGYSVKLKLKHYVKYLRQNDDDSPLYIFDSHFDDDKVSKDLLNDYSVPSYFSDDLFRLVGERRRPPYRWFLIGPQRSGTCVHIDPLGTSAWNTVLFGRKRWVLFPPSTRKSVAKGLDVIRRGEDDEAIHYFINLLPRIRASNPDSGMIEFIQYPGETVFVPGGWWHGVINLDDTVAVTQNFCSHSNFDRVWRKTRVGRKRMAVKWLQQLERFYPHLASRARLLNQIDNFEMRQFESNSSKGKDKKNRKSKG